MFIVFISIYLNISFILIFNHLLGYISLFFFNFLLIYSDLLIFYNLILFDISTYNLLIFQKFLLKFLFIDGIVFLILILIILYLYILFLVFIFMYFFIIHHGFLVFLNFFLNRVLRNICLRNIFNIFLNLFLFFLQTILFRH